GSGADGCYHDLYDCTITADSRILASGGGVGRRALGVAVRGGLTRLYRCTITAMGFPMPNDDPKNPQQVTEVVGVWLGLIQDNQQQIPTWATVEVYDSTIRCQGFDGCKTVDLIEQINDQKRGSFKVYGGSGSGPGGAYITQGNVVQPDKIAAA